jgi:hypothetical protein
MAAVVAPGQHQAAVEVTRPVAAEATRLVAVEVTPVAEAAVVTRAAEVEVEVIPEVVDIPATIKRVDRKLL